MLIVLLPVLLAALIIKNREKAIHGLFRLWARLWFFFIRIRHRALNKPFHEAGKPYIFIANHISYLDIPTIVLSIKNPPAKILGKAELGNIPIFGWIYKIAVVCVERENPKSKASSLQELKTLLSKNVSVIIFPEGGFNETEDILKSFYNGAFSLSQELGIPIAPVLLLNTCMRLNQHSLFSFRAGDSIIEYLPLIYPRDFENITDMKQHSFDVMKTALLSYNESVD